MFLRTAAPIGFARTVRLNSDDLGDPRGYAVFALTCFSNAAVQESTICCRSYGLQSSSTTSVGPISSSSARLLVVVTTKARPCMTLEFRIRRRYVQLVTYGGATS